MNLAKLAQIMSMTEGGGLEDLATLAQIEASRSRGENERNQNSIARGQLELARTKSEQDERRLASLLLNESQIREKLNPSRLGLDERSVALQERGLLAEIARANAGISIDTERNAIERQRLSDALLSQQRQAWFDLARLGEAKDTKEDSALLDYLNAHGYALPTPRSTEPLTTAPRPPRPTMVNPHTNLPSLY